MFVEIQKTIKDNFFFFSNLTITWKVHCSLIISITRQHLQRDGGRYLILVTIQTSVTSTKQASQKSALICRAFQNHQRIQRLKPRLLTLCWHPATCRARTKDSKSTCTVVASQQVQDTLDRSGWRFWTSVSCSFPGNSNF